MIDLCRWGLGVDYPIRVTSNGGRFRCEDDQETPDTNVVTFVYPDRKSITWEGLSCNRAPAGRPYHVVFHGENGSLGLADNGYVVFDPAGKELRRQGGSGGDAVHFRNFLDAVKNGGRLNSEIEEGYKSTLPCLLGNIAYRLGRTLTCDAKNGRILNDKEAMTHWQREYAKGWEPRV
jgi:predicted dehydrogenase